VAAAKPDVRRCSHVRAPALLPKQAQHAVYNEPSLLAAEAVQTDANCTWPSTDRGTGAGRGRLARARARACSPPSDAESSRLCARRLATSSRSRCSASAFCCAALRRAASLRRARAYRV